MTTEGRKDWRYYTPLSMGFILILIGLLIPPAGVISSSVLCGTGMFLCLSAGVIGLDLPEILKQINELKKIRLEESKD